MSFRQAFLWMTDTALAVGTVVTTTTKDGKVRQQTVEQCFPYDGKYGSIVRPVAETATPKAPKAPKAPTAPTAPTGVDPAILAAVMAVMAELNK